MTQINFEDIEWQKDEASEDAEVVKLDIDDAIEGLLLDKYESKKYNCMCYKIQVYNDPLPKIILSTTVLEKMMETKNIGDLVKIVRLQDGTNQAGTKYSRWETYHAKLPDKGDKDETSS